MFSKSIITLAALAVAQVTLAQPYCLLTAVNKFEHPADQKTLCCKEASQVKDYLKDLCPSGMLSDAVDAFNTACKQGGYGSCSSSTSNSSVSSTSYGSASATGAPYPITRTTTYYDTQCSCTKTAIQTSNAYAGSTGLVTGAYAKATGASAGNGAGVIGSSGSAATGSPIVPAGSSGTGSSTSPSTTSFKGAATRNVGSVAAGLLAVAAIAMAL